MAPLEPPSGPPVLFHFLNGWIQVHLYRLINEFQEEPHTSVAKRHYISYTHV
jgi:hypothetical protein